MTADRVLPEITDETQPYWLALEAGHIALQRCSQCGYVRHPIRWLCPECLSEDFAWDRMVGTGTVHTFVWYYQAFDDRFTDIPYNVTVVELTEGPRLITNVLDVTAGELVVGQAMQAAFEPVDGDRTLLFFRPA